MKQFPTTNPSYGDPRITNLDGVAVGDEFMINNQGRWDNCSHYIKVICKRVTPKQAIIGERRYWIKDGTLVGEYGGYLMNVDEQVLFKSKTERQLYTFGHKFHLLLPGNIIIRRMVRIMTDKQLIDEKRNLKKACNHIERIRMRADRILNEPMSVHKMSEELQTLSKQALLAHRRINELFFNNTDLGERLDLGNEYDGL